MCETCGCSNRNNFSLTHHDGDHIIEEGAHHHDHNHHDHSQKVDINEDILSDNNLLAVKNRSYFEAKHIIAINFVSSPGSGKTSLLEKTITKLKDQIKFFVIEGDQQTSNDAERIHKTGASVVQINTGSACHLDAHMVSHGVKELKPAENSIVLIENVGNLVCPALFDLGESFRVVVMSTTEGEDKPLKYPYIFSSAQLCIINKIDLLPYVDFDLNKAINYAKQINPKLTFFSISVTKEDGLEEWLNWVQSVQNHAIP